MLFIIKPPQTQCLQGLKGNCGDVFKPPFLVYLIRCSHIEISLSQTRIKWAFLSCKNVAYGLFYSLSDFICLFAFSFCFLRTLVAHPCSFRQTLKLLSTSCARFSVVFHRLPKVACMKYF